MKREKTPNISKNILSGAGFALFKYYLFNYIIPFLSVAAVPIIGYLGKHSFFEITIGSLGALAFVSSLYLVIDEIISRKRIEDRLSYAELVACPEVQDREKIVIGIFLQNYANFPIDFAVNKMHARIQDRTSNDIESNIRATIPPYGHGYQYTHAIQINVPEEGLAAVNGHIDFDIYYGKKNHNLKYRITGKKQFFLTFENGQLVHCTSGDFPQNT